MPYNWGMERVFSLDVDRLRLGLGPLPEGMVRPALVVMSGLPGTGKSSFARRLAQRSPFLILESDVLRRQLFPTPTHSAQESARLFRACHALIDELLGRGIPIIFDATNLTEHHREYLYHIAEKRGARLILARVEAPAAVVQQRLEARSTGPSPDDHSDADWRVYHRMKPSAQGIRRSHFAVDTSRDVAPVIEKILREIRR